jgi:hypothetical protein
VKKIYSNAEQSFTGFVYADLEDLFFGYCIRRVFLIVQNIKDLQAVLALQEQGQED